MVFGPCNGHCVTQHQSGHCTNHADQHALEHENTADLPPFCPHGNQHCHVLCFLHHHHDQGNQNVQSCDKNDQSDGQKCHHALKAQRAKQGPIFVHPVLCH